LIAEFLYLSLVVANDTSSGDSSKTRRGRERREHRGPRQQGISYWLLSEFTDHRLHKLLAQLRN